LHYRRVDFSEGGEIVDRREWIEGAKVVYHPNWIRRWREDPFSVPPIYLEVSPVGHCNHRCTFCAVDMLGYVPRFLDPDIFVSRIKELREMRERDPDGLGVRSIQYAGEGEPTLYKELTRIYRETRDAGIDIGMLTNATGLSDKLAQEIVPLVNGYIQASVNAGTEHSYARLHQTSKKHWGLVWRNLENALEIRNRVGAECDIGVNMTAIIDKTIDDNGNVVPPNWPETEQLVIRARDAGMDYVSIKPYSQHPLSAGSMKRYGEMSYREMMQEINETGKYLIQKYSSESFEVVFRFTRFEEYENGDRKYPTCLVTPTIWSYIQSDGLWLSCSAFWTDDRFTLGNINDQSIEEIWYGEARRKHLEFVLNGLDISECRKTCHPDKENVFLTNLLKAEKSEQDRIINEAQKSKRPKRANFI
jgi:wyosine [tRNA(Phe)-imidazoG37] synthetase (radical SAM superfamily)